MNYSSNIQSEPHGCHECELSHGDQAPTADELEISRLRAENLALKQRVEALEMELSGLKFGTLNGRSTTQFRNR